MNLWAAENPSKKFVLCVRVQEGQTDAIRGSLKSTMPNVEVRVQEW